LTRRSRHPKAILALSLAVGGAAACGLEGGGANDVERDASLPPPGASDAVEASVPEATTEPEAQDAAPDVPTADVNDGAPASRRVFVSSTASTANLGGPTAADGKCQTLANAQSLGGTWLAWVSNNETSPAARFTRAQVPYRLLDGTLVANNWEDLTDGTLAHVIDRDEKGKTVTAAEVWTGTAVTGQSAGDGCTGFTTNDKDANAAQQGVTDVAAIKWTNVYLQFCDRNARIYCFEQ
jgi:hypothetical protein